MSSGLNKVLSRFFLITGMVLSSSNVVHADETMVHSLWNEFQAYKTLNTPEQDRVRCGVKNKPYSFGSRTLELREIYELTGRRATDGTLEKEWQTLIYTATFENGKVTTGVLDVYPQGYTYEVDLDSGKIEIKHKYGTNEIPVENLFTEKDLGRDASEHYKTLHCPN